MAAPGGRLTYGIIFTNRPVFVALVGTDPGPAQQVPRTTKRGRQVKPRRRLVEED